LFNVVLAVKHQDSHFNFPKMDFSWQLHASASHLKKETMQERKETMEENT